jgi:tRNA dimethylallyltransferase
VSAFDAIALLGPTASGKSRLAMALAARIRLEIISVDSAQVYRAMDIGTAKPSAQERARVPHHLIDLVEPSEAYSAARFVADAGAAIASVRARGALPLLVGGTMLYIKALREGLSALPSADLAVRERIAREASELGWPQMHRRLAEVDPQTAARLEPGDAQRIQRALEVFELAAAPMSALLHERRGSGLRLQTIALVPSDRARLHRRIEDRFDAMLAAGFLDEVRALRARGDLNAELPSMRSVGYRQAWDHLQRGTDFGMFRESAFAASRQLAKRQLTWLRSIDVGHTLDPDESGIEQRLLELI